MAIADQSRWNYVLTDIGGSTTSVPGMGKVQNASSKQYSYHVNAGKTAQFTINLDNPCANAVLNNDALLKVYRREKLSGNWVLHMVGDVIHAEESAQGDTGIVTVVAADPWWRLNYRFIGLTTDAKGRGLGVSLGTSGAPVDIGDMVIWILALVNSDFYSGITFNSTAASTSSYIGPLYAQNVQQLLQQLVAITGAPDIELVPVEPSAITVPYSGTQIALLNVKPSLGTTRPNCVFEYGTGQRNLASYDRLLSKDGICNEAFSLPTGWPGTSSIGDSVVVSGDIPSMATRGLFQDVLPNDLVSVGLRQELCDENVAVRTRARQQITVTPTVDCNLDYGVDYGVGDTVTARAFVNGAYRVNGTVRIYGVDFSVDDNDAETPSLVLIAGG